MVKLTKEQYQQRLDDKAPLKYEIIGEYLGGAKPLTVIHKGCGKTVYFKTAKNIFKVRNCPHCNPEFFKCTEESVKEALAEKGIKLLSPYTKDRDKHKVQFKCGCIYFKDISNLKNNMGITCTRCEGRIQNFSLSLSECNQRLKDSLYGSFKVVSRYRGWSGKTNIVCLDCNHIHHQTKPENINKRRSGCTFCNNQDVKSVKERFIKQVLSDLGIVFTTEKTFKGLTYKGNPLRVDVFLPERNLVIEYDGGFHDTSSFTQETDKVKNKYFKDEGIPLLRINYKDESILGKLLPFITERATAIPRGSTVQAEGTGSAQHPEMGDDMV